MAIYDDNVGLESFMLRANRIAQRFSACHTHEAPISLQHPQPVPQYQSPCRWTPLGSLPLNVLATSWLDSASIALPRTIISGPAPSDLHVQRPWPRRLGLLGQFHLAGPKTS